MLGKKALSAASAAAALPIEDVFSTWLYTGGLATSVTNGIDLSGKGGMVWIKARNETGTNPTTSSYGRGNHFLFDTLRSNAALCSSSAVAQDTTFDSTYFSFLSNGFGIGTIGNAWTNVSAGSYSSWSFRQAPRFFDVVTYTGTGANRTIAHDLGVVPGCIIVKRTDTTADWQVYHRSNANTEYMVLNTTAAKATGTTRWNSTTPTSAVFSLGTDTSVNASGGTYVAYLFAHDPLGPSGDGSDGLIACGLHTQAVTDANELINLGWEPQWVLTKRADSSNDWILVDNMRGFLATGNSTMLRPNLPNLDGLTTSPRLASNGFVFSTTAGQQHIYIAIRRGPMREPTSATEVFGLNARTGTGANATVTGGLTADSVLVKNRGSSVHDLLSSRLTGTGYLVTSSAVAEAAAGTTILQANPWDVMNGVKVGTTSTITNASGNTFINYLFKRAPGFFDVVTYTGTTTARSVSHNLGVVPELIITKSRSTANWLVDHVPSATGAYLDLTSAFTSGQFVWNDGCTATTISTTFIGSSVNAAGQTYIAYLFASLPGISKVGTYTGNGSSQTIDCGFTTGARFVLIKRTSGTGDWYVWDTARGIITGNDPYFRLNADGTEVATNDTIDPASSGFIVNQVAATNVNVNTATYVYLAIA
jgi:hypothetical protein